MTFSSAIIPRLCPWVAAWIGGLGPTLAATTVLVSTPAQLDSAISAAQPGDTILMSTGAWTDVFIDFDTDGLPGAPITLRADVDGQVTLEGESKLQIAGDYLVVRGLHFTNGAISGGHVIEFRGDSSDLANHSRLTECAISAFNPPDPFTNYKWVSVYGLSNRVDHCAFTGMDHIGVTLTIWLGTDAPANHTRIDNNYFAHRAPGSGNGYETIRIGTSARSLQDSQAIVESNVFHRCDGEIEIISNKSGGNVYRYNTFEDCAGQLTLRHGNGCVVEGNFFLGNNNSESSGVRVIGEDHSIVNNYFGNLRGNGYRAALAMMNGIPESELSGYSQVKRAQVVFNTFVGCRENLVIGIQTAEAILPPLDCVIANNIVKGGDPPLVEYVTPPTNLQYEGNIFHGASLGISHPPGIMILDPLLAMAADGLMRPATNSPVLDAATTNYSILVDMDGHARAVGTQDVGADEAVLTPPIRGPLTPAQVGPRWTRPTSLRILSAELDAGNAVITFEDSTGLAPRYSLERSDGLATGGWAVVAVLVPVAHTSTVFQVADASANGSAGFWRVSAD